MTKQKKRLLVNVVLTAVAIVAGSVVVVGIGIFALIWFVIKKKTWAEFLAIFKK